MEGMTEPSHVIYDYQETRDDKPFAGALRIVVFCYSNPWIPNETVGEWLTPLGEIGFAVVFQYREVPADPADPFSNTHGIWDIAQRKGSNGDAHMLGGISCNPSQRRNYRAELIEQAQQLLNSLIVARGAPHHV